MAVPIGQKLREVRLARGLSLQDVQHHTRISRTLLVAMENDDLGAFPNQTYARTFFAAYARHLGVEASSFLRHFQPHGLGGVIQYHPYLQAPIEHTGPERRRPSPRSPGTPSGLLIVILVAVALTSGAAIWAGLRDRHTAAPAGPPTVRPTPAAASVPQTTEPPSAITPPVLPVLRATPVEEDEVAPTPAPPASPAPADEAPAPLPLLE